MPKPTPKPFHTPTTTNIRFSGHVALILAAATYIMILSQKRLVNLTLPILDLSLLTMGIACLIIAAGIEQSALRAHLRKTHGVHADTETLNHIPDRIRHQKSGSKPIWFTLPAHPTQEISFHSNGHVTTSETRNKSISDTSAVDPTAKPGVQP